MTLMPSFILLSNHPSFLIRMRALLSSHECLDLRSWISRVLTFICEMVVCRTYCTGQHIQHYSVSGRLVIRMNQRVLLDLKCIGILCLKKFRFFLFSATYSNDNIVASVLFFSVSYRGASTWYFMKTQSGKPQVLSASLICVRSSLSSSLHSGDLFQWVVGVKVLVLFCTCVGFW